MYTIRYVLLLKPFQNESYPVQKQRVNLKKKLDTYYALCQIYFQSTHREDTPSNETSTLKKVSIGAFW